MEKKFKTLHPKGKKGTNILKWKYDFIKKNMLDIISKEGEITYQDLSDTMVEQFQDTFEGSVAWYVVTVKLDLEARKIIERIPKTSPHKVKIR